MYKKLVDTSLHPSTSWGMQSKYCYYHAPRVCTKSESGDTEGIVQVITAKKETRGGTYYEVSMCPTIIS